MHFLIVLGIMEGAWLGMWLVMQKKPTVLRFAAVLGIFAVFVGAIWLGLYWNHADLTCHPGQHCFPWGY
jgi:uncharacterized membrane protein YfcA